MIGVNNCGPQKYDVPSTIRNPNKNKAVAANDLPNISKTPAISGGKPSFNKSPPITPNTVMNNIGFNIIDFNASYTSVFLDGLS